MINTATAVCVFSFLLPSWSQFKNMFCTHLIFLGRHFEESTHLLLPWGVEGRSILTQLGYLFFFSNFLCLDKLYDNLAQNQKVILNILSHSSWSWTPQWKWKTKTCNISQQYVWSPQGIGMFYRSKPVNHLTHIIDQTFKTQACSRLNHCLIV